MLHDVIQKFRATAKAEPTDYQEAEQVVMTLLDCADILDEWYDHEMYPFRHPNTVDRTRVRTTLEKLKKALNGYP
jgi:hypothetical protein